MQWSRRLEVSYIPEALSFKADVSDPKFIYQKKKKTKRGEVENPIEVVKKVLIGIKGLLD